MKRVMGVEKMSKLFLATYSAHESILNVLNQKCKIECLFVNAGGLRVPPGIRSDKPYLSKYSFVKGKTLHAKVAFFSEGNKKGIVWLWTGNLRKSTFESQNILMRFPIGKGINELGKWFSEGCEQHIVFKSDGGKIIKIPKLNKVKPTMWGNFKESLLNIESEKAWKAEDDIHIYIFSPWGAKKVVKEIRDFFGNAHFSLYTQADENDENIWVDCSKEDERYVASKNAKFPHFKCMFVCRGKELIWSYVGSANFTQSAMLGQKNVEHALFFEGKQHNNKEQQILLEQLKKLGWEKRDSEIKFDKKKEKEDPNVEQKYESRYDPQSFIEQGIANKVLAEFSTKKNQKKLEESYAKKGKGAKVKSKEYELEVIALEWEQIYVRVYPKKSLTFELSIPRKNVKTAPPVTQEDVSAKFDELDSIAFGNGNGGGGGGGGRKKGDGKKDKPMNVRFPMEFYKGDSEVAKEARSRALKIIAELRNQKLDNSQKLKLAIWSPLLKMLG